MIKQEEYKYYAPDGGQVPGVHTDWTDPKLPYKTVTSWRSRHCYSWINLRTGRPNNEFRLSQYQYKDNRIFRNEEAAFVAVQLRLHYDSLSPEVLPFYTGPDL